MQRATLRPRMPRTERFALAAAAITSLVLRAIAFFHYRFDSDEPQHLHVAWGWTQGLIQYRDLFDNHMPLFHVASAPLLAALGERAGILLYMRASMLPLYAFVLFATYRLAVRLYSRRVALWSVVLLSLLPPFFLKSLEYRNDNLWAAIWMVALLALTAGAFTTARSFLTGLLLGIALITSIKTAALAIAVGGAVLLTRRATWSNAIAGVIGSLIAPAAMAIWFYTHDAWKQLVWCNLEFNSLAMSWRVGGWLGWYLFPAGMAVILRLAWRKEDSQRLFCAVLTALYIVTVVSLLVLVSPRDLLVVMPLLSIFLVAAIDRVPVLAGLCAICAGALFYYADGFRNRTDEHITMMNQVLGLTRPGEPLMDIKGETIYRRRPHYYAFEQITRELARRGAVKDTVPEDMIAARCYVSQAEGPMYPPRANQFIHEHSLDLGRLRAAGQWIAADGTYQIAIPGRYVIVSDRGLVAGPFELTAGTQRIEPTGERLAVLWAPAFERGYSPFHLRDREF